MAAEAQRPAVEGAPDGHRSGFVAIVGRPNVGKSTLLNRILGRKIAIVTPKPQTTRRRVLGIKTLPAAQILFVDTPGIHRPRNLLNERMVGRATQALREADVALWLVDADQGLRDADRDIAALLQPPAPRPVVALNKIDRGSKARLLPLMKEIAALMPGCAPIPISALTGENLELLLEATRAALPEGPRYYATDEVTGETERAVVAEIVREKVILATRDEVPYAAAVTVDAFEDRPDRHLVIIKATIHVDRASQKPILIGQRGGQIKAIGQAARAEIERFLGAGVYLELFVRVQPGWTKTAARLREFGL